MWIYHQHTGKLFHENVYIGMGYSGYGTYKNKPGAEGVINKGPIPKGRYHIDTARSVPAHGPFTMALIPDKLNNMHGRSGMLIHGDNPSHIGHSSNGCIILARSVRLKISMSSDHELSVVQ